MHGHPVRVRTNEFTFQPSRIE